MTTSIDLKYGPSAVEGSTLVEGDVTIDSLGNLYLVTAPATFIEEFGGEFIARRDFVDGAAVGHTYFVEAASRFMVKR